MSRELGKRLVNSESADVFLQSKDIASNWKTVSALKSEVDRLIGSDLNAARNLSERVEEVAAVLGDRVSRAFAQASRARVLHHTGRYEEADSLYKLAISATRAARLTEDTAVLQMHRVFGLTQMGRYEEALTLSRIVRRVLVDRDPIHLAQLETNVGIVYYRMDRYRKAIEHYERAREILRTHGDDTTRAVVDTNLSHALMEVDRHKDAYDLLEQAAKEMERSGQKLWAAQTRFHIGYLQFLRGNYNSALNLHYRAKDELEGLGSAQLVAWCRFEIAEILLALNSFDDAIEHAAAARDAFNSLNLPYESAQAAVVHALAAMGQEEFGEARRNLLSARRTFERTRNSTLSAMTDCYLSELALRSNRHDEANRRASSALKVFARQKLATRAAQARLLNARAAYESGELAKASRLARAALKSLGELSAPSVAYQCHLLIGRVAQKKGRNDFALENFRKAVGIIDAMRGGIGADDFKASFLKDKINAYEEAIAACLDSGAESAVEEAFALVESSKSRALADLLSRYIRDSANSDQKSLSSDTRKRLARLIEDLNWYGSQAGLAEDKGDQRSAERAHRYRHAIARCEREIGRLFRRLETEAPAFFEIQQLGGSSFEDLQSVLEADETVVEYFTTGSNISAFIASSAGIQVIRRIAPKDTIEQLLSALRFQIEKFNYGAEYVEAYFGQLRRSTNQTLKELYSVLVAPLETALAGSRVIFIPHDILHYVPFHALHDGNSYLVDRFEISYSPSATVFRICRARSADSKRPQNNCLVALGLAETGTPNIVEEIDELGSLFPESVLLTRENATLGRLIEAAPRARFLHLASHGYFRRDNPMFSFLKLADANLHFYSLLDMKLNAELVTLSACHTGVNRVFPGDELHGLLRGFLYAGAPSVVASLWAVSDKSTADFMKEMYVQIRGGATKRAAMRLAQLSIKEAYGHPYYWAPFVLMGDPG